MHIFYNDIFSLIKLLGSKSAARVSCSNFLDRKLDTNGTLERSFFDFLSSFPWRKKTKKKLENIIKYLLKTVYTFSDKIIYLMNYFKTVRKVNQSIFRIYIGM